jgi:beta-glucosidase
MVDMMSGVEEVPEDEKVMNRDYTIYEEGIYVGYRHFDKKNLEVSYPFGFGLSYTEFDISALEVEAENDTIHVKVTVTNSGDLAGKEVIQVYTSKPDSRIDRPDQELKGFAKTQYLEPGATEDLEIKIPVSDLSYWEENKADWVLESGKYVIQSGASSRDIGQIGEIEM